MGTASKKPEESGSEPEYKAHFELWSEASRDNGDGVAASNGGRGWTAPALSAKPVVASTPREAAAPAPQGWSRGYWALAVAAIGALLAVLVLRPWKSAKVPLLPVNLAARPAMKVRASPKAMPSVAAPPQPIAMASPVAPIGPAAAPSAAAPVNLAAVPVTPMAKPMQTEPSIEVPAEPAAADGEEEESELAPEAKTLLESAIRSELARAGFSPIGVSVSREGDVFLNGAFLSPADEGRAIAMVRGHADVRDIYFSGRVWRAATDQAGQAPAPEAAPPTANLAPATPPPQFPAAQPEPPAQQPLPSGDSPQ